MKALVVFESLWGNSEQVARAIADGLAEHAEVTVVDVRDAPALPGDVDLVVAGGPTHAFSMSRASTRKDAVAQGAPHGEGEPGLRDWLEAQPRGGHHRVATFDTRVTKVHHLPGSAARSAARSARKHGFAVAAEPHSFYVEDMAGPLADGELERAAAWGRELAAL